VRCRWIIGADGFHSRVRQWAGLGPVWKGARRIGLRQHFRIRPWTDFVEVYWHNHCQAYVTPIGTEEVCIAMLGSAQGGGAVFGSDQPVSSACKPPREHRADRSSARRNFDVHQIARRDPGAHRIGGRCIWFS
jgi:2-polyprenyl-6-methoxyphenol hydroxylase-like FAD-dependent oxidoreductase